MISTLKLFCAIYEKSSNTLIFNGLAENDIRSHKFQHLLKKLISVRNSKEIHILYDFIEYNELSGVSCINFIRTMLKI
jgi:hypothetical protein